MESVYIPFNLLNSSEHQPFCLDGFDRTDDRAGGGSSVVGCCDS